MERTGPIAAQMTAKQGMASSKGSAGFVKDVVLVGVAEAAVMLCYFMRLPVFAKSLGASAYGSWSIIWVTVVLVTSLTNLGLEYAVLRFLAAERDVARIREGFFSAAFVVGVGSVCISVIAFLLSGPFAGTFGQDGLGADTARLASLMILTQTLSQFSIVFFRTFSQVRIYAILRIGQAVGQLVLATCLLILGLEVKGIVIGFLCADAVCVATAGFFILARIGFGVPRFTQMKTYLKYGLPLIPSAAILWIIHSSNRYVIGHFMGLEDVGLFTAVFSLAQVLSLISLPLQTVLLPALFSHYDLGDVDMTRTLLGYSLKYLLLMTIPAAFGLSVLAIPLLNTLTNSDFNRASTSVPFVAFGLVFYGSYVVLANTLHLVKRTVWVLVILGVAAGANVGLSLMLVPHMGIVGAGLASLVSYMILALLAAAGSVHYFRFDLDLRVVAKSILASAVMALAVWLLNPTRAWEVAIAVLVGMIVYASTLVLLKGVDGNDIRLFSRLFSGFSRDKQDSVSKGA